MNNTTNYVTCSHSNLHKFYCINVYTSLLIFQGQKLHSLSKKMKSITLLTILFLLFTLISQPTLSQETHNSLSGPIPPFLAQLSKLNELRLDLNKLTGSMLPASLGSLHLSNNQLSGNISHVNNFFDIFLNNYWA